MFSFYLWIKGKADSINSYIHITLRKSSSFEVLRAGFFFVFLEVLVEKKAKALRGYIMLV